MYILFIGFDLVKRKNCFDTPGRHSFHYFKKKKRNLYPCNNVPRINRSASFHLKFSGINLFKKIPDFFFSLHYVKESKLKFFACLFPSKDERRRVSYKRLYYFTCLTHCGIPLTGNTLLWNVWVSRLNKLVRYQKVLVNLKLREPSIYSIKLEEMYSCLLKRIVETQNSKELIVPRENMSSTRMPCHLSQKPICCQNQGNIDESFP